MALRLPLPFRRSKAEEKARRQARTIEDAATLLVGGATTPQWPEDNYETFARHGYGRNEIVFACFPADTLIARADGQQVAICDIVIGDEVRTHTGRGREVTEVMQRRYDGRLYKIKRVGRSEVIEATAEHPFYVARRPKSSNAWYGYHGRAREKTGKAYHLLDYQWAPASEVQPGDYLTEAIPTDTTDTDSYTVRREREAGKRSGPHTREFAVSVTTDLMRLVGYYLAEGWCNGGSVRFAFHEDETDYHADVADLMDRFFGTARHRHPQIENGRSHILVFNSRVAVAFFRQFGGGAKHKSIPDWIMRLPAVKQVGLLAGLWRGDGCRARSGFHIDTASHDLAECARLLILRQGIVPLLHVARSFQHLPGLPKGPQRTMYRLTISGDAGRAFAGIVGEDPSPDPGRPGRRGAANRAFIYNGRAHYPVRSVTSEDVQGLPVHNLEVAEDHSYHAGGVAVHNCITEIATSGSQARLRVVEGVGSDQREVPPAPLRPGDAPDLAQLIRRPNPRQSQFAFLEELHTELQIAGNVYVFKLRGQFGQVLSLHLLRPDRVRVVPGITAAGGVAGYVYTLEGTEFAIAAEDIGHIKRPNPFSDWYGLAPLHVLARRVNLDNDQTGYLKAFFSQAGVPSGLLNLKRKLRSDDEARLIRTRWRGQFAGQHNWHNIAILDEDATYQQMALDLDKMVLPDLSDISEARICGVFGVPMSLVETRLGMQSGSYANRVSDEQNFWRNTMQPEYRRLVDELNLWLAPEFGGAQAVEADFSAVAALAADEQKRSARIVREWEAGLIARDEAREALGYDPAAGDLGRVYRHGTGITYLDPQAPAEAEVQDPQTIATLAGAARTLIDAGFEPSAVLAAVGLPPIAEAETAARPPQLAPFTEPPQLPPGTPADETADEDDAAPPPPAKARTLTAEDLAAERASALRAVLNRVDGVTGRHKHRGPADGRYPFTIDDLLPVPPADTPAALIALHATAREAAGAALATGMAGGATVADLRAGLREQIAAIFAPAGAPDPEEQPA